MKPVPFNISHKRYYLGSYALGAVRHPRCVTADYTVSSEKRGLSEPAKNKKGCSAIKGWAEIQKRCVETSTIRSMFAAIQENYASLLHINTTEVCGKKGIGRE